MKRLPRITLVVFLAIFMSGCFINSLQPFHTDDLVIDLPVIRGNWFLVKHRDKDVAGEFLEPWIFEKDSITTYEDSVGSVLAVKYFKIGDIVFADLSPGKLDDNRTPNDWWMFHSILVHSVCKVDLSADTLSITPLAGDWVWEMLKEKKVALSHACYDNGENVVLTSPSEQLASFLKQHGNNPEAFPGDSSFIFRRIPEKKELDADNPGERADESSSPMEETGRVDQPD